MSAFKGVFGTPLGVDFTAALVAGLDARMAHRPPQDLARVERHLPEILGRALARAWIDGDFSDALRADPKGLLARYQVYLPTTVAIEIETTETQRQRIVVYENRQQGDRRRVMYLQLVMLAGK